MTDLENHMVLPIVKEPLKADEDAQYEIIRQQEVDDLTFPIDREEIHLDKMRELET